MTSRHSSIVLLASIALCSCNTTSTPNRTDGSASSTDAAPADAGDASVPGIYAEPRPTEPLPFDAGDCQHVPVEEECQDGWCRIPAGCFIIGSPENEWGRGRFSEDRAAITFTRSFEIQQHELTQAEWTEMGLPNPSGKMDDGTGDCLEPECPVGNVTWFEAVEYANRLSEAQNPPLEPCYVLEGCTGEPGEGMGCEGFTLSASTAYECEGYRLPTDAEWEYAARAGTRTAFYSGDITEQTTNGDCFTEDNLEPIAWYCANSEGSTHPVGLKQPNDWGLFDMSGNVLEWAHEDTNGHSYPHPSVDPRGGVDNEVDRQGRGGLFNSWSPLLRSASRPLGASWDGRGPGLGFRLARTLPNGG